MLAHTGFGVQLLITGVLYAVLVKPIVWLIDKYIPEEDKEQK